MAASIIQDEASNIFLAYAPSDFKKVSLCSEGFDGRVPLSVHLVCHCSFLPVLHNFGFHSAIMLNIVLLLSAIVG